MSTRNGHKLSSTSSSSDDEEESSRSIRSNRVPCHSLAVEDIENRSFTREDRSTSSGSRRVHGSIDKKQRKRRWVVSSFQSSPFLQRLFVLRKWYFFFMLILAACSCLRTFHRQFQHAHRYYDRQYPLYNNLPFTSLHTEQKWPLPSVVLKDMLPTKPLDKPSASYDSASGWPRVSYFEELPSVDDPLWPPLPSDDDRQTSLPPTSEAEGSNISQTTSPPTIATCVPGLAKDVYDPSKVSKFIVSNQRQQLKANELIFVFSDVHSVLQENRHEPDAPIITGDQWCLDVYKTLQDFHSNLVVICIGERLTAGRSRNVLARVATSDILAYIDTDDEEEPERNAVIQRTFECNPDLKLLLHSNYGTGHGWHGKIRYHPYNHLPEIREPNSNAENYDNSSLSTTMSQCPDQQPGVEVIRGRALRELLDQTQDVLKFGIRTVGGMRPGHLVVKRSVTKYVRSSSIYKGQDTLWARDIIYMYGRRDETSMFLNRPLTTYYQSSQSFLVNVQN